MFCPQCGIETIEGHRFCKSCGLNLAPVSDAITGRDSPFSKVIDVEGFKREAAHIGRKIKFDMENMFESSGARRATRVRNRHRRQQEEPLRQEPLRPPKPKEWLCYSRQHNLRDGLLSLFGGAGMGVALYYLGQEAVNSGAIARLQELWHAQGLESVARLVWIIAAIPVLKGFGQILYGTFFAESIAKLSERLVPKVITAPQQNSVTSPQSMPFTSPEIKEPPPTITEHTTDILGKELQS